jgi:hypothetical protein
MSLSEFVPEPLSLYTAFPETKAPKRLVVRNLYRVIWRAMLPNSNG